MVLCGRAQHGRTANVDVFYRVFPRAIPTRNRRLKRIQVHHHQVDARNSLGPHHFRIVCAPAEDAAMDLGMQGLYAALHDLRGARIVGDFHRLDARRSECRPRAAGGKQFDAEASEGTGQLHNPGLVGDAQKRPFNL